MHEVCKSCIFLLEGTGQSNFLGVDWWAPLSKLFP